MERASRCRVSRGGEGIPDFWECLKAQGCISAPDNANIKVMSEIRGRLMVSLRQVLFGILAIVSAVVSCQDTATAQANITQITASVVQQLQTGALNPNWYGQQLWMVIAQQTGGTGRYMPLTQLGPVTNVSLTGQIQLPAGPVYAVTVQHQFGVSNWQLGISSYTNRIEYGYFTLGGAAQPLPPQPTPAPPQPTPQPGAQPTPPPNPGPKADPTSAACQKFPNLC